MAKSFCATLLDYVSILLFGIIVFSLPIYFDMVSFGAQHEHIMRITSIDASEIDDIHMTIELKNGTTITAYQYDVIICVTYHNRSEDGKFSESSDPVCSDSETALKNEKSISPSELDAMSHVMNLKNGTEITMNAYPKSDARNIFDSCRTFEYKTSNEVDAFYDYCNPDQTEL